MTFWTRPPEGLTFFSPVNLIATWFGSGLLRPAAGTWGTLAALPFAWGLTLLGGHEGLLICTILVFLIGTWSAGKFEAASVDKDPGSVVVDEVVGIWITLLFVPQTLLWYGIAFAAFRFFDILKIWPISVLDKKVKGGPGIMLDDVLAGLFAGGLCLVLLKYI